MEKNRTLCLYGKAMSEVKLSLWKDLPDIPVYADKLLHIVNSELSFMKNGDDKIITRSMINNYVKWDMIPKPFKKKYEKLHIASVIVITVLKQVLPIAKIKDGIQLQAILQGTDRAYDAFCKVLEESLRKVFMPILEEQGPYILDKRIIEYDELAISSITTALSNKLLTEKIIETKKKKYLSADQERGKENE